jgi:hypothetical protein
VASAQLAQLQHVEGLLGVEDGLVQLAGAQLVQLWLDEGVHGRGGRVRTARVVLTLRRVGRSYYGGWS